MLSSRAIPRLILCALVGGVGLTHQAIAAGYDQTGRFCPGRQLRPIYRSVEERIPSSVAGLNQCAKNLVMKTHRLAP